MAELTAGFPPADRFGSVVVDEAQDFADGWWAAVLAVLRDPATGGLFLFADEGQRVFARQGRTLQLPPSPAGPQPPRHQADRQYALQPRGLA